MLGNEVSTMNPKVLINLAIEARENAYAPYSNFKVGAALLCENGEIFTGCNIENAAYGPTNCAERTAFFKAISEGIRRFSSIAIVGYLDTDDKAHKYAYPCGICRQVMMEFCDPDSFTIIAAKDENDYTQHTLGQLFPNGFGSSNII